jgi:hypothetical protein
MPAKSQSQRAMMCKEAAKPGSTQAKGISQKSAAEYCHTPGKLPSKAPATKKK